jgi:hypothetical protein
VLPARDEVFGDVLLEVDPLTPLGELGAVLDERQTYELTVDGRAAHRSPFAMRHRPAGTRPRRPVHPAHRCPGTLTP